MKAPTMFQVNQLSFKQMDTATSGSVAWKPVKNKTTVILDIITSIVQYCKKNEGCLLIKILFSKALPKAKREFN